MFNSAIITCVFYFALPSSFPVLQVEYKRLDARNQFHLRRHTWSDQFFTSPFSSNPQPKRQTPDSNHCSCPSITMTRTFRSLDYHPSVYSLLNWN